MPSENILLVKDNLVKASELTYEDLIWLINDYCDKHEKFVAEDFRLRNNLPTVTTVKRILKKQGIDYLEFLYSFDKHSNYHRYFNPNNYDDYVQRYIKLSNQLPFPIQYQNLKEYDLPTGNWFVKYCPDDNVKSWNSFVNWCGFMPVGKNKYLYYSKEIIGEKLLDYEKELGRPIRLRDIKQSKLGFSYDVISKFWNGLEKCKQEIGLIPCIKNPVKPWGYYDSQFKIALSNIYSVTHSKDISWDEYAKYKEVSLEKRTIIAACKREGKNIYDYFNECGFRLINRNGADAVMRFGDGEICVSTLEQRFSLFLRENNISYERNIEYNSIDASLDGTKYNCDYVIDKKNWIEICGFIRANNDTWKTVKCRNEIEQRYQDKLFIKEDALQRNGIPFLFLFQEDFDNDEYKRKTIDFLNR